MEAPTIIVVGVILALLAMLSFLLMKVSSKEYPKEEIIRPKFQPRKVTDLSNPEAPKKRYYKKKRKKKPTVANNAQVEKRSVGRPRKVE
jgi:hypothetical protein